MAQCCIFAIVRQKHIGQGRHHKALLVNSYLSNEQQSGVVLVSDVLCLPDAWQNTDLHQSIGECCLHGLCRVKLLGESFLQGVVLR